MRAFLAFLWADYRHWEAIVPFIQHANCPQIGLTAFAFRARVAKITKTTVPLVLIKS